MTPAQHHELVAICQAVGARVPTWNQGAGGNISFKDAEFLWIKASGQRLSDVSLDRGIVKVSLQLIRSALDKVLAVGEDEETYYSGQITAAAIGTTNSDRPSMETGFHALLPRPWVAHFHSLASLLMSHERRKDQKKFESWLRGQSERRFSFLPPVCPGWDLCNAVRTESLSDVIVLETHGVILQSDAGMLESNFLFKEWLNLEVRFCVDFGFTGLESQLRGGAPFAISSDKLQWSTTAAPLRFYFPDTAVFFERIQKISTTTPDGKVTLNPDAPLKDRSGTELFQATALLYSECPGLEELPREITSVLSGLPTEVFRVAKRDDNYE